MPHKAEGRVDGDRRSRCADRHVRVPDPDNIEQEGGRKH